MGSGVERILNYLSIIFRNSFSQMMLLLEELFHMSRDVNLIIDKIEIYH
jgi:hypothetical protein